MEVSGLFHAPATLPPRKEPPVLTERWADEPQSRSGRGVEEKKYLYFPCWHLNHGRPVRSLVTILTEVHRIWVREFVAKTFRTTGSLLVWGT